MRFLADMGVSLRVVEWLRNGGHDARHLREERLQRLPNGAIFEKAATEARVLLTFDLDFGEIVALSGGRVVSVVVFRLRNARSSNQIARLQRVLADSLPELEKGAVVVVEEARHRIRRLPFGT
jgi:predicted nuclease of predicted toxin-antitoxin system